MFLKIPVFLKKWSINQWAIAVGALIALIVFGYGIIIISFSWPITFGNVDKAGVFGDSFGALTSLFSGLAFGGIVYTILLQRKELELQRKELALTRKVLVNQVDATKLQNFESTFFQMLRLHNEILNVIDLRTVGDVTTTGRDCFVVFYHRIQNFYLKEKKESPSHSVKLWMEGAYTKFWKGGQQDLGHYFRYLYTIFKFVKASEIEDKRLYTNIVRAQLSDHELLMLFYNCLYKFGVEKFKPLTEEFAIFDNLPQELLLNSDHVNFYKPEAFGSVDPG